MLAHARVDNICWNGTSAAWLGLDEDRRLCELITRRTGKPATSSMLGLVEILMRSGRTRYALVTPYTDDVQARIIETLENEGFDCAAERHLGITENFAFSTVESDAIVEMIRDVAPAKPQSIIVLCTNLRAIPLVTKMEDELGLPIYDSIATAVWSSLRIAGIAPGVVAGWGRLFQE
jgi:maleate isomerase